MIKENASQFLQADGLFSVTDLLAFGAMQALKELKIRIPQDISVIGYDDIPLSSSLRPKLTTIHQPREKIAQQTCLRLIEKIQKKEPVLGKFNLAIRPRLVIRESSHER